MSRPVRSTAKRARRRRAPGGRAGRAAGAGVDELVVSRVLDALARQRGLDVACASRRRGRQAVRAAARRARAGRAAPRVRLPTRVSSGTQPTGCELREDELVGAGHAARRVDVLDAHQPAAAVRAGVEPAGQRGHQRAGVQRPGGRGREAPDVAAAFMPSAQAAGVPLQQRAPRGRAVAAGPATTAAPGPAAPRLPCGARAGAPGVVHRSRRPARALHGLDTSRPAAEVRARHRLGQEAAAQAAQLRLDLGLHAWPRSARPGPGSRFTVHRRQALRRVGHRHGAVAQQLVVGDRASCAASGWCGATAKTKSISPSGASSMPAAATSRLRCRTPIARSAWP